MVHGAAFAVARVSHTPVRRLVRQFSAACPRRAASDTPKLAVDVDQLLAKPTWSVRSLLAEDRGGNTEPKVSAKQLHHLLRLSALPPPKNAEEEASMISTLSAQLRFVEEIQKVHTDGVEPLQSLRDETISGEKEAELNLAALQDALEQEEIRGKHHRRIRRRETESMPTEEPPQTKWNPLEHASRTVGRYFVVQGGKDR